MFDKIILIFIVVMILICITNTSNENFAPFGGNKTCTVPANSNANFNAGLRVPARAMCNPYARCGAGVAMKNPFCVCIDGVPKCCRDQAGKSC
jgi:hypothetical protein